MRKDRSGFYKYFSMTMEKVIPDGRQMLELDFLTLLISTDTSFEMEALIAALQETNSHRYFCH